MPQILYQTYFNNTILTYITFLAFLIISLVLIKIIGHFLLKRLNKWAGKTKTTIDDLLVLNIKKYLFPIAYFSVFYLNTKALYLNATLVKFINIAVAAFIIIIGAILVSTIVVFTLSKYLEKKFKGTQTIPAYKWLTGIIKTVIWGIALLLFFDNIGIKINSLITGLGIGGLAIAFASQAVLADIFCFFTIFFDRPFEIGDFIVTGEQMGTVEHIGIKTTRLRALSGEQLIFSNSDLTNSRVRNYKTMKQRRVLFKLGVTYDTSYDKLKQIPGLLKEIIENVKETTFSRAHFVAYAAYSLNFEIAYYVLSSDYDKYMDIHQEVNFCIKEVFEQQNINFAFPTQTLHVQNAPPISTPESDEL